jgi:hypothetical protein
VEQRVWEARPKEEEGKGKLDVTMRVAVVGGGEGARNSVDSDKGEGLGYEGGDPEELGVRRIWEGEHWRHRGARAQFPEGLCIWDLRPSMGLTAKNCQDQ